MIKLFLLGSLLTFLGYTCVLYDQTPVKNRPQVQVSKDTLINQKIDFVKDIEPIFKAHCAPCHFPTGIMWIRLPFDDPKTLRAKPEDILRRIEDPAEAEKIKAFLEQGEL